MSQPSGSQDAQSRKRNVGGGRQNVDPRSHKEGIRRHVVLHYWTGGSFRQVSGTLRVHGDWKSWKSTSRFHRIGTCLRLAGQLFTSLPCLNPRLRVIVLKHWRHVFYVEPSSLLPSLGSSAEPNPRMYWRASTTVLKRGVAVGSGRTL